MEELIKELQAQNKTLCLIEATDGVEVSRIFQTLKDKDKIFDSITIASVDSVKRLINSTPESFDSLDQYYKFLTQVLGKKSSDFLNSDYGIGIICTKEVKGQTGNGLVFISIYDSDFSKQISYNCSPIPVNCNDATMATMISTYIIKQLKAIISMQKQNQTQKINKKR